jgi:hypothetical protein
MMMNELKIYELLTKLQGTLIPLILYKGWVLSHERTLITNDCGTGFDEIGIENISLENKQSAITALEILHNNYGILHGDVALRNILLSKDKFSS